MESCFSSEVDQAEIWNLETGIFESNLTDKSYDFLRNIDFEKMDKTDRLGEIYQFHQGGAFYLSYIFETLNQPDLQLRFLTLEMIKGRWSRKAAEGVYSLLSHDENWSSLAHLLELYMEGNPSDYKMLSYLFEAFYKSGQYEEAISYGNPRVSSIYFSLSQMQMNDSRWHDSLEEVIYSGSSSLEVEEIYQLILDEDLFSNLGETEQLYLLFMSSSFRGNYTQSASLFKNLEIDEELFSRYPTLYYTLRLPLQNAGLGRYWNEKYLDRSSFASSFNGARLYLRVKEYTEADTLFRLSITLAGSDYEEDRARWYLLDMYKNNVSSLSSLIEEFAPLWHDPSYFSDILDEFVNLAVSRGKWEHFERIFPIIVNFGDSSSIASFCWVKYLSPDLKDLSDEESTLLLAKMKSSEHMSYYNVMGTLLSGNPLEFAIETDQVSVHSESDEFLLGFLDFSLETQALEFSSGLEKQLSNDVLRILSRLALDEGNELRSIQLSSFISLEEGKKYSRNDIQLRYPNKYEGIIDLYSSQYGFPGEVLSGIIRTESAFTHDIISYAGAIGLSQLMPDTAAEQAGKLKIHNPDFTDPETNIQVGSAYVRWILDRDWSDNMSQVLIAYNAGGGNLRKWKRMYPGYRDELFVEAIPYKETRNYVKKVLTSSLVYGAVYQDHNPEDIVRGIYPDFNSLKLIQN